MAGGDVIPARRARLYAKRPPCSTMAALIGSSPFVNASIAISSPLSRRSRIEKSVVVRRPMFWLFWP